MAGGARRLHRSTPGCRRRCGGDRRLLPGAARTLQGPARIFLGRQSAAQCHGKGAAFPPQGTRRGRCESALFRHGAEQVMRVAVLGGGNGSFAAAGDLALAGHEVRWWRRNDRAVATHLAAGGHIIIEDFRGRHTTRPSLITADIAEAVRGAELIVCPTPATAHHDIATRLAPHLAAGQVVFLPPGTFGSVLLAKAAFAAGNRAEVAFAETGTLPWLTRKHGAFEAAITIRAKRLPTGVFPLRLAEPALAVISRAFPGVIEACGDALSASLMNAGPIIHPPLIIMNAAPLEHFERWDIQ